MLLALTLVFTGFSSVSAQSFHGEKSSWHGFDRYDFIMDEETLQLTPILATPREGNGVAGPEKGKRRCIVVVPKQAAPGNPWTWRGCYWDHQPQAEVELLKRGFHVAYITTDPDKTWDTWYAFLTKQHGLNPKPAFIGMSRGGSNSYTWGTNNPDKVLAICADNPGLSQSSLMKMDLLAKNDVPLLNICGSIDPILHNTLAIQNVYHANGGRISVVVKDGPAHHPHSLQDPNLIADFIEKACKTEVKETPSFLPERFQKSTFYSTRTSYDYAPTEKLWLTKWGPEFTGSFDKYSFGLQGVEGSVAVFVPENAASGNPWVYRCDQLERDSEVDFALLAQGFHIVVASVPYNADGSILDHWNSIYNYLTGKGFSTKPILAGRGASTGEMYCWGIENPDKVSCIYGENPIMRASIAKVQPMDNLASLAKAKVPVLHVCGSLDPNLKSQTRETEKKYKQAGGKMTVLIDNGRGHYPLSPNDPSKAVDFILSKCNLQYQR